MISSNKFPSIASFFLPPLLGGYAVLSYVEKNIVEVNAVEAWRLFGGILLLSILINLLLRRFGIKPAKAAFISALVLVFFIYAYTVSVVTHYALGHISTTDVITGWTAAALAILIVVIIRSKLSLEFPVIFLSIVAGIGFILSAGKIAIYEMGRIETTDPQVDMAVHLQPSGEKRNIIYIIFDRYADERTLKSEFGYNNSGFTSYLRNKGFYVADHSTSNYLKTAHSLSSSLSMEYHEFTDSQVPGNKSDWTPYFDLIDKNKVAGLLKNLGYKYIHLGSWWPATATNSLADENFQVTSLSQIEIVFLREGVLNTVLEDFQNPEALHCLRVPRKFERLNELAFSDEPSFVFAHFLVPHDPYVFDRNGRCISPSERLTRSQTQGYLGQVEYINKMVMELVENIDSRSALKPIVIVQADEGPFPPRYRADEEDFQWESATPAELKQKMRILNAYYFPGIELDNFYSHITPVNSFRLLFNSYFGAAFPILEDANYAYPSDSSLYDFFDVTDVVR